MPRESEREPIRLAVPARAAGERLDRFLAAQLDESRNRVQTWIREGRVTVDGEPSKPAHSLVGGERIVCDRSDEPDPGRVVPQDGPLSVVHEDEHVVVVDKPAGIAMHPGAGRPDGTLANVLLSHYPEIAAVGSPRRPGIVHRLDLDTTGVVVVARSAFAYRRLSGAFAERRVHKVYLAICYGLPSPESGRFEQPIGRHRHRRTEMTVRSDGRTARTDYELLASARGVSALRLVLGTGRTHQIRVHCKAAGHPLVGDPTYGEARWKNLPSEVQGVLAAFPRPALHAWRLEFLHPGNEERVSFEAAPPEDLRDLWRAVSGGELPLGVPRT